MNRTRGAISVLSAVFIGVLVAWTAAPPVKAANPQYQEATTTTFRARDGGKWHSLCDEDYCRGSIVTVAKLAAKPHASYLATATFTMDYRLSKPDVAVVSAAVSEQRLCCGTLLEPGAYKMSGGRRTSTTVQWAEAVTAPASGVLFVLVGVGVRDGNGDGFAQARGWKGALTVTLTPE